jgi:hypothetical protein
VISSDFSNNCHVDALCLPQLFKFFSYQLNYAAFDHNPAMKHLDVIDGEIAAVPLDQRPSPSIIGQNLTLLYLKLRLSDAETWMACTATPSVVRLETASVRDYILKQRV